MVISQYVAGWNLIKNNFDIQDYLDNAFYYVDEVVIALNKSDDDSFSILSNYRNYLYSYKKLVIIQTNFSYEDPFCYGKIVNAALQCCSGDVLCLRDFDERNGGDLQIFRNICKIFLSHPEMALFAPVINLYGDYSSYIDCNKKWYFHKKGLFRGAVNFGLKTDGRPDYNKTSTDELIDKEGNLVSTVNLVETENPIKYMKDGWPFVYHLGYVDFKERVKRNNEFWIPFWEKATGGDKNNHATNTEQLEKRESFKHGLPLWNKIKH